MNKDINEWRTNEWREEGKKEEYDIYEIYKMYKQLHVHGSLSSVHVLMSKHSTLNDSS